MFKNPAAKVQKLKNSPNLSAYNNMDIILSLRHWVIGGKYESFI